MLCNKIRNKIMDVIELAKNLIKFPSYTGNNQELWMLLN